MAFCFTLAASLPALACAQPPIPPPPISGPPVEDFTLRYRGYVVDEVLTREVSPNEDQKLWRGHFEFVRENRNGSPYFQILASGIGAIQADGMHLILMARVAEPQGDDPLKVTHLIESDPAVAAGLIKLISVRRFDLDEPFR